ncbi:MAG: hypothetical protein KGJ13_02100 [Patescibacteria group bacterium]|nr:hypothetical protein [Patescibacteria group bacterium]
MPTKQQRDFYFMGRRMRRTLHVEVTLWADLARQHYRVQLLLDRLVLGADDEGRLSGDPLRLKKDLFPCDPLFHPRRIEESLVILENLPYRAGQPTLRRYTVGNIRVLQLNTLLWNTWNKIIGRDFRGSRYPDDPAVPVPERTPAFAPAHAEENCRLVAKYWNESVCLKPTASWTSPRLNAVIADLCEGNTPGRHKKRWTRPMLLNAMYNFALITQNPLARLDLIGITIEEFFEDHASRFIKKSTSEIYGLSEKLSKAQYERFKFPNTETVLAGNNGQDDEAEIRELPERDAVRNANVQALSRRNG